MSIATALSIAGSDPSGGAGIQADLKAFSARGVYGMAVLTALTAQNTTGVSAVHLAPADFVIEQIRMVRTDVRIGAVKIGMIASADIAEAVGAALEGLDAPIVLDPVMVAKGGAPLLPEDAVSALIKHLMPKAALLTPNLPEAAALLGAEVAVTRDTMVSQGNELITHGPTAVLMKGGHLDGDDCPDLLVTSEGTIWLESPRIRTTNTHGTGCTLSSAITAELAKGQGLADAVSAAKTWLTGALQAADALDIGAGHGPVHHFHQMWGA